MAGNQEIIDMPVKYNTEVDMCREVTMIISASLIPIKHRHIPEVPRCSHNNHSDMLFICDNGNMFIVEYKLNDFKGLLHQVMPYHEYTFGVINRPLKQKESEIAKANFVKIFSYTGKDWEIDIINDIVHGYRRWNGNKFNGHPFGQDKFYNHQLAVYYWGYKNFNSSLEGGHKNCKRLSFFELYKEAIKNLQEEYSNQLDAYLVYNVLGFYSRAQSYKYFKEVMHERKKI